MNVFYCVIAFKQAQTVYTNDLFFSYYNFTTFAPASLFYFETGISFFGMLVGFRLNNFRKFQKDRRRKADHSTMKRIFLSHLQTLSMILSLNVPWPKTLKDILTSATSVASVGSELNGFECLWRRAHYEFYVITLVTAAVLPIVFVGIMAVYWFIFAPFHKIMACGTKLRQVGCSAVCHMKITNKKRLKHFRTQGGTEMYVLKKNKKSKCRGSNFYI